MIFFGFLFKIMSLYRTICEKDNNKKNFKWTYKGRKEHRKSERKQRQYARTKHNLHFTDS